MTVYIDDSMIPAKVGNIQGIWSHLFADTKEELHAFADKIGLKRSWYQPGKPLHGKPSPFWHYDVTKSKRKLAIDNGAVPVTWRESVSIIRRRENLGIVDDL